MTNIILLPVNTTQPPFPGRGNGGRKREELSTLSTTELYPCLSATFNVTSSNSVHRTCFLLYQQGQRVRYTRFFLYDFFLQFYQVPNDVNRLSIQAKVSAVLHMGNILCFVM